MLQSTNWHQHFVFSEFGRNFHQNQPKTFLYSNCRATLSPTSLMNLHEKYLNNNKFRLCVQYTSKNDVKIKIVPMHSYSVSVQSNLCTPMCNSIVAYFEVKEKQKQKNGHTQHSKSRLSSYLLASCILIIFIIIIIMHTFHKFFIDKYITQWVCMNQRVHTTAIAAQ